MLPERDRDLLRQVVGEFVNNTALVEWVTPAPGWSAHVRLRGATGLVSQVLTSPEWQEARFEEPRCSVLILTTTDEDNVREALAKLTRAAVEYAGGGGQVEEKRGLLGTRTTLVLRTSDGEWRIGRRSSTVPS